MKGWRTILFNVASVALMLTEVLPPKWAPYVVVGGNIVLRLITTTPVGRKE